MVGKEPITIQSQHKSWYTRQQLAINTQRKEKSIVLY